MVRGFTVMVSAFLVTALLVVVVFTNTLVAPVLVRVAAVTLL